MLDPDRAIGSAQRRPQCRLRSVLRHVPLVVKMSLAEVGHHSFQAERPTNAQFFLAG